MQKTIKKLLLLFVLICTVICCAVFAACNHTGDNTDDEAPHVCADACPECGKCLTDCAELECAEKCPGHEPVITHECEDACPECNKCLTECAEPECAEKCPGHVRTVPVTVNLPEGVTFEGVFVQPYVDGKAYGEPVAIVEGAAELTVHEGTLTVELTGAIPDYVSYKTTVTDDGVVIDVALIEFDFEIYVTVDDDEFDLSTVTVLVGDKPFEIVDGVVSGTLVKGEYAVTIEGLNGNDYSYETQTVDMANKLLFIEIKANFVRLYVDNEVTVSFADATDVKNVRLPDVEVEKVYVVGIASDEGDGEDENADNLNKHNFILVYNEKEFTLGKDRYEAQLDTFIVIEIVEGVYSFTIKADGAFANATISISEYEVIDHDININENKTVYISADYRFVAPEYGYYKLEVLNVESAQGFYVNLGEPAIGGESGNSKPYCEFYANREEEVPVDVYFSGDVAPITLIITRVADGNFILGSATAIAIPEGYSSGILIQTFKAPVKGNYKIELSGVEVAQVSVSREGKDPVISWDENVLYGNFTASKDEEVKLHFINMTSIKGDLPVNVTITLIEVLPDSLAVGGSTVVRATPNTGEEKYAIALALDGIVAGREYFIVADGDNGINNIFGSVVKPYILYNGESSYFDIASKYEGLDSTPYMYPYVATFTAVKDVNQVRIVAGGASIPMTIYLVAGKVEEAPSGPAVGDTVKVTPGATEAEAVELNFGANFVAGGSYTLGISEGDGWYMYEFYLVFSNGEKVKFEYPAGDTTHFEVTFTANGEIVKIYATHMRNAAPTETTVVVLAAPSADAPSGPAVSDTVKVTPGATEAEAVELNFGANFVAGGSYTLGISEGDGWYMYEFYLVFSNGEKVKFDYPAGDTTHFEVTFTANGEIVKIYATHMRNAAPTETTVVVLAAPSAGSAHHVCKDVCPECNKCTTDCGKPECEAKCEGHKPAAPDNAYWSQEVKLPKDGMDMANYTVFLEAGEYTITISGDIEAVMVNDGGNDVLGNSGTLIASGATSGTFKVTVAGEYTIRIINLLFDGSAKTINIVIEAA